MNPRIAIALVVVAALALGGIVLAAKSGDEPAPVAAENQFAGAPTPADLEAPDFRLRDEQGKPVSMRTLRGKPVVVTFLYSHCEDTCPITAQTIRVPALAISVDPPNDTPASARRFLAEQRANGRIRFVLGSRARLRPIWKGYGVTPQRVTEEHVAHITLVDSRGFQRVGYPISQATPERLAHDLRLLERETG